MGYDEQIWRDMEQHAAKHAEGKPLVIDPFVAVYTPGTTVELGSVNDYVCAVILAVMIESSNRVSYKVVWWSGRERNEIWVDAMEVQPVPNVDKVPIGFLKENS